MNSLNKDKIRDECIIRLYRTDLEDEEFAYEILMNETKPTKHPYVPMMTIFPEGFRDDKPIFLIGVSAIHFGHHYSDMRNCGVYIRRVFDHGGRHAFGTFLEGEDIAQAVFYPLEYKIGEEIIVARVREHNLRVRNSVNS